jgi:hypothetical protein
VQGKIQRFVSDEGWPATPASSNAAFYNGTTPESTHAGRTALRLLPFYGTQYPYCM